jgi:hypothetical protein
MPTHELKRPPCPKARKNSHRLVGPKSAAQNHRRCKKRNCWKSRSGDVTCCQGIQQQLDHMHQAPTGPSFCPRQAYRHNICIRHPQGSPTAQGKPTHQTSFGQGTPSSSTTMLPECLLLCPALDQLHTQQHHHNAP